MNFLLKGGEPLLLLRPAFDFSGEYERFLKRLHLLSLPCSLKRIISVFLVAVLAVSVSQAKKKTSDKVYDVGMDNVRTLEAVKDLLEVRKLDEMTVRLRGVKILSVEEPVSKAKSKISKAASTVTFGLINSKYAGNTSISPQRI